MYELENEFVSFSNMMVSAPSSIMSAVTFFTSIPAYYTAGNYSQFRFDNERFWCINDLLKLNGYKNYSIMNARTLRERLADMVDVIDTSYWTSNVRHSMMRWPNSEVTKIFYNLLDSNPPSPSFNFLWYNVRLDPLISSEIKGLIENLKKRNLFKDSIIILTSDHGYPDMERGLVSDGWDLMKKGLTHDIILTNDNINVPFLLYYPGVKPRIVNDLASTEDIMPTIMELLNVDIPYEKELSLFGRSLVPLINNKNPEFFKERVVRTDARFSMQTERITSLQKGSFHYIIRHIDSKEELYDTENDPKEKNNIALETNNKKILHHFREYFLKENQKILELHKRNTCKNLQANFNTLSNSKLLINNCCVIVFGNSYLYEAVVETLRFKYPDLKISLIIPDKNGIKDHISEYVMDVIDYNELDKRKLRKFLNKNDLRIEVVDDPTSPDFRIAYGRFSFVHGRKTVRINWNGEIISISNILLGSPQILYYKTYFKKIFDKIKLGIDEPIYFVDEFHRLSKRLFGLLSKKFTTQK